MEMTRDERSLLLYLETCAVDRSGRVDGRHMNAEDFEIARRWNETGFLFFRRRRAKLSIGAASVNAAALTHVVKLGDTAWAEVSRLRRERAERTSLAEKEAIGSERGCLNP